MGAESGHGDAHGAAILVCQGERASQDQNFPMVDHFSLLSGSARTPRIPVHSSTFHSCPTVPFAGQRHAVTQACTDCRHFRECFDTHFSAAPISLTAALFTGLVGFNQMK